MELIDVVDFGGVPTGRVIQRGEKLNAGEYYLGVHIYIENSEGEYLIQKRSIDKSMFPDIWDLNMGHVTAGEKSIDAAIREIKEEIGVTIQLHEMNFVNRIVRDDVNHIMDIWKVNKDIEIRELVLKGDEVSDVKYVGKSELLELLEDRSENRPFRPDKYIEIIRKM